MALSALVDENRVGVAVSDNRWLRVKEILGAALDAPADRRAAVVEERCGGDAELRAEVESLLEASAAADRVFEQPLVTSIDREDEPNIGVTLGSYRIEEVIGRGGMGTVYLARRADDAFERRVAIKMIRRGMDSELVVRRFRHERRILATLDHPNVAALFDGGTTPDGLPYFVMEYVEGTPIDRYADDRCLSTTARIELFLPVLDAVQHAHERHIVHRDIKPGNVMVTAAGQPKLLDFGIAKLLDADGGHASTFTSVVRPMTPEYASPEQLRGEPITEATDVYALGLLLYELLTGHHPYRLVTRTPEEMARLVSEHDPERPSSVIERVDMKTVADGTTVTTDIESVSRTRDGSPAVLRRRLAGPLDDILLKALRKEADQRYPSAAALAEDLRRFLADQPVAVSWDARRYRAQRAWRRHRMAIAAAILIALAVGATAVITRTAVSISSRAAGNGGAPAVARSAARPSVAVVGFRNLSERPADQWMSTAMAEMLTTELGGDGQLRVLPSDRVARVRSDIVGTAAGAPTAESIERLRATLASDYAIVGTFAISEGAAPRAVRIDVRVHRTGSDPIAVADTGDEAQLFAVVANLGRELRAHLGLRDSSPETTRSARAAFPQTLEGTKLYAEGMARLRLLDGGGARDLLERAAAREPDSPMIETALASAWTALGYDARAAAAAQKAFDSSAALSREDRLNVEGRLYEAQRKWPNAVDVYRTLWGFFSDNVEYGLRLAAAQTAGGQAKQTFGTIDAMRRLPSPQNVDPRIDYEEAQAASAVSDYPRAMSAIDRVIQRAERDGARSLAGRARLFQGRTLYDQGQLDRAEQTLDGARRTLLEVGDRAGAALALNARAAVLHDQHDITQSVKMYEQALAVSEEIGDRRAMSAALNNLGVLLKDERRYDEALRMHVRALALRREIDDRNWMAISLSNIGVVYFEQDRFREASDYYRQSLAIAREIGDRRGQIRALHNLAIVERYQAHLQAARAGYEESIAAREAIGDKRGLVIGRVELGAVQLAQGDLAAARETENAALTGSREVKLRSGEAEALFHLGEIAFASGDLAAARGYHDQAMAIRRDMKETRTIAESRVALAELTLEEGRAADAQRELGDLLNELAAEPDTPIRITAEILSARAALAAHDVAAATRSLSTARRLSAKTERIDLRQSLAMAEAELDAAQGENARARERLTTLRGELARAGMVLAELECRTAMLRLDRAERRSTVQADAAALERDARSRGAGLVLKRVQTS